MNALYFKEKEVCARPELPELGQNLGEGIAKFSSQAHFPGRRS
jgi:hypothetical protein